MYAVEMQGITKRFGGLKANDDVSISVQKGEIHALVGENGAGKSTLMNVLYGIFQPEAGKISINQKEVTIESPAKAIRLGIGMVHQHFMLIPPLTVKENVILGQEPLKNLWFLNLPQAEREIKQLSELYHIQIDPNAKVENLSVGIQQRLEILKLLYRKADILILDEPTAVLTPQEADDLFNTLRHLKEQSKTVILITHKLNEVKAISDSVTVMRKGKFVSHLATSRTTQEELALLMVGREIISKMDKSQISSPSPMLVVENLSALNDKKIPALKNVSFSIQKGEILGIAGVEGNGQSELVQVLTGLRKATNGTITIPGIDNRKHEVSASMSHIPEDRLKTAIVLDFPMTSNLILGRQHESKFSSIFSLKRKEIDLFADKMIEEFDIRPPKKNNFLRTFSGGNQQKIVIARELSKGSPIIVASHPTRGLDIGAIEFVHQSLLRQRNEGKAVLLVSSDITELLTLSDRIMVMFEGEIVAMIKASDTSEKELGAYMTGAIRETA